MKKRGNNGNHGKKGRSGRKPIAVEFQLALKVQRSFEKGFEIKNPITRTADGRRHVKLIDWYLARALKSDKVLMDAAKKVMPDKIEQSVDVTTSNQTRQKLQNLIKSHAGNVARKRREDSVSNAGNSGKIK